MRALSSLEKKIADELTESGMNERNILALIDSPEFDPFIYAEQLEFLKNSEETFNENLIEVETEEGKQFVLNKGKTIEEAEDAFQRISLDNHFINDIKPKSRIKEALKKVGIATATAIMGALAIGPSIMPADLMAQTQHEVNINGQYIDQLGNPITDAAAELFNHQNFLVDSENTNETGNYNLETTVTAIQDNTHVPVTSYYLSQNWPNPFNPTTNINLDIMESGYLHIFNILGQKIGSIYLPKQGSYTVTWGGANSNGVPVASGVYIYKFISDSRDFAKAKKMILLNGGTWGGVLDIAANSSMTSFQKGNSDNREVNGTSVEDNSFTLKFSKYNTTPQELNFTLSGNDTTINVTGNVGPSVFGEIDTSLNIGEALNIDLWNYEYNDSETDYTPGVERLQVSNGYLQYTAQQGDTIDSHILFKDAADPTLPGDTLAVKIKVNEPENQSPVFGDIPEVVFNEDSGPVYLNLNNYLSDDNTSAANLLLDSDGNNPTTVSIDSLTHISEINAPENWFGQDSVTFTATDQGGLSSSKIVYIRVTPDNDMPTFSGEINDYRIQQGSNFEVSIAGFNDIENDKLNFDIPGMPEGTIYDWDLENKKVTVTPPADITGEWNNLKVVATEAETPEHYTAESDEFKLTIDEVVNNHPPYEIKPIGDQNTDEGEKLILYNWKAEHVKDDDGDPISLIEIKNILNKTNYAEVGNDLEFTPTDENDYSNIEGITIRITDGTDSISLSPFTWTRNSINDNPVVGNIPNTTFDEDTGPKTGPDLDDYVSDVETSDENIDWTVSGNNNISVSIDPNTRIVTYNSPPNWYGSENITFTAMDEGGLTDSKTTTATVKPINDAPNVGNIPNVSFDEDTGPKTGPDLDDYVNDIETSDADINWEVSGNTNISVSIDPNTRIATFDSPSNWYGSENITFKATDEGGLTDSKTITVTVNPVNDAPYEISVIGNQNTDEGVTLVLENWRTKVGDIEGDPLSVINMLNLNGKATYTEIGNDLHIIPTDPDDYSSINNIIMQVTDGTDILNRTAFNWTRNNTPDAPVFSGNIADKTVDEGYPAKIYLPDYFSDVDNTISQMTADVLNLTNATKWVDSDTLKIKANSSGTLSGLIVKLTDPTALSAQSNSFDITTNSSVSTTNVTFSVQGFNGGTASGVQSMLIYYPVSSPSQADTVTSTSASLTAAMETGVNYDIKILNENSVDSREGINFLILTGSGVYDEMHGGDQTARITPAGSSMNLTAYKLMESVYDGLTFDLLKDYFNNTVRFADSDLPAPAYVYVDVGNGYQPLTSEQEGWLNELISEAGGVGLGLSYQSGSSIPSVPYLGIAVNSIYPAPSNGTNSTNNIITAASATYPLAFTERSFKIEIWQALFDLPDQGGDPPVLTTSYTLNSTAQKAMKLVMTYQPGARFE
ncbi:hypothetical protein ACFLTH_04315 [Bacteroidota bacterium]